MHIYFIYIYIHIKNNKFRNSRNKKLHHGFENIFEGMVGWYDECLIFIMMFCLVRFIFVFDHMVGYNFTAHNLKSQHYHVAKHYHKVSCILIKQQSQCQNITWPHRITWPQSFTQFWKGHGRNIMLVIIFFFIYIIWGASTIKILLVNLEIFLYE